MVDWLDAGYVALLSVISLAFLFVLTKLMGNRQMSQLTLFDYISGITLGSLAGEMAIHPEAESWLGLVAMAIYAAATILLNRITSKSRAARHSLIGGPTVLFDRGTLYYDALQRAKLDLSELMTECRSAGYFDLSQLQMVLLEPNGKLSFLPNEQDRPLTPKDMQLSPAQSRPPIAVIMDGVLLPERLKATGNNEVWLQKQLTAQGYRDLSRVLLATVDATNALAVYDKDPAKHANAYFS